MNTTPSPGAPILKMCLNIAPLILCFIGIFVLFRGMSELYALPTSGLQGSTAQGSSPSQQPAADVAALKEQVRILSNQVEELSKSREVLKDRLDSVSQQASHVQWLLSIVLVVAGLLTLAQGVFAFFSAQNYVKQAEDAIKRANDGVKEMDSLAADVRARYPMFTNIEEARAEAFKELSKLNSVLDRDYENLYATSEWLTRQKILAIESFSAMQFLAATDRNKELTKNLQLLGKFYGGKFKTDATALATDFERARYYLHLALQKSERSYSVLNDYGWLFSLVAKPPRLEIAKQLFEESLRSDPLNSGPFTIWEHYVGRKGIQTD
jgi:tetratricopeptide (TPR) repeat protein